MENIQKAFDLLNADIKKESELLTQLGKILTTKINFDDNFI